MAIKMRVLYNSAKPKIKNIANEIKAHYELGVNAVDVIPPAYSCDKEDDHAAEARFHRGQDGASVLRY